MFSTIALTIIAIAICILIITYYRERTKLVQQLLDIDNSLSEMRRSLNKLEYINNKMLTVENKVQNSIDKIANVKNYITNDITANLISIKKLIGNSENTVSTKLNIINKRLDTIGSATVIALEEKKNHCEAKNSSKISKTKHTTKTNKQENNKLKTAE